MALKYFDKNAFPFCCLYIVFITLLGFSPLLINSGGFYPNGDATIQILPFIYETKKMLSSGTPFWSWNTYMGDNFIASYAYYTLTSPFALFNCLFPYEYLNIGFTITFFLKFIVCGYISFRYFKKIGFGNELSYIGCILYTFSGYAISNTCYFMFMEPMIFFPILLISIERYLKKERHPYSGLILGTFVVCIVNYYFAPINVIAGTLYYICRISSFGYHTKEKVSMSFKAFLCVVIGILACSVIFVPVVLQLSDSARITQRMSPDVEISFIIERLLSLFIPKFTAGPYRFILFKPYWDSCGISISIFGISVFIWQIIHKNYHWYVVLSAIFVIIYLTPINGLFNFFTDSNYCRWTYALILSQIICILYLLNDKKSIGKGYAIRYAILVLLAYLIFAVPTIIWRINNPGHQYISINFTIAIGIILIINVLSLCYFSTLNVGNCRKQILTLVIITSISISFFNSLFLSGNRILNSDDGISHKDILRLTDSRNDSIFKYRYDISNLFDKYWTSYLNSGLILNRPSLSTYHSVRNSKYDYLSKSESVVSPYPIVFAPVNNHDAFRAIMSVKEICLLQPEARNADLMYNPPVKLGQLTHSEKYIDSYAFPSYIPMGFTYTKYTIEDPITENLDKLGPFDFPKEDIANGMLNSLLIKRVDEPIFAKYLQPTAFNSTLPTDSLVKERRRITCSSFKGDTKGFDATINLPHNDIVFFSVAADEGFSAKVDGIYTPIYEVNLGLSAIEVPSGKHHIRFDYFTPGLRLGAILSIIAIIIASIVFLKDISVKHDSKIS